MVQKRSTRWAVATALSLVVHVSAIGVTVVALPQQDFLPRIRYHEVASIPITRPPEPQTAPPATTSPKTPAPATPPTPDKQNNRATRDVTRHQKGPSASKIRAATSPSTSPAPEQDPRPDVNEPPPLPATAIELPPSFQAQDLNKLLPDGAQINILVRTAQLAQSPHAAELRQTIRAVPGFELYFGESGFDPLTDFETMLVRTTDLSSLTHTLIVATLAIADERAEATMRRLPQPDQTVSWRRDRENRWTQAHLPPGREGNLSWAILRDKQNHYLAGPAPWVTHVLEAPTELTEDEATQQLAAVRLDGEPAHLALVTPSSQLFVAPGVPRGQATSGLLVAAHFGPSPRIVARQWFTDRSTARRFLERLRQRLSSLHRHPLAGLLDVTSLVENVEFHQQDSQVTAYLPLEAAQLRRLLTVAVLILDGGRRNHEAPTNPN